MDAKTFGIGIKKLCAYYEKSIPPRETIELWLQKVEHLPSECMLWIISQITDSQDRWPTNLPCTILKLWPQWFRAHPEKQAHYSESLCSDCDHLGLLHVRSQDGYVCVARCKCGKSNCTALPAYWMRELRDLGYVVDDLDEAARWRVPSIGKSGKSNINWTEYVEDRA